MNLYLNVFSEAAHYASLIPLSNEPTFFAMHAFASDSASAFNMPVAALCAVAGAMLGATFNFAMGYGLKRFYLTQENPKHLKKSQYENGKKFFAKYGFLLLLISWLPIFNFSVLAAGFLGMRAKIALPIVLIGEISRYGWFLFN